MLQDTLNAPSPRSILKRCRLPFYTEHSCALGVVMMTYLDELCTREDPTSEVTREEMKIRTEGWFEYCDFAASQKDAFHLWNAVSQPVTSCDGSVLTSPSGLSGR